MLGRECRPMPESLTACAVGRGDLAEYGVVAIGGQLSLYSFHRSPRLVFRLIRHRARGFMARPEPPPVPPTPRECR